jgi:hypothetical protein
MQPYLGTKSSLYIETERRGIINVSEIYGVGKIKLQTKWSVDSNALCCILKNIKSNGINKIGN